MIFGIYAVIFILMLGTLKTKYHVYTKTLTSLTFLAIAIIGAIQSDKIAYLYALLPGLIGCVIGDFLLATKFKKSFLYGLLAFLIANLCYVMYFFRFSSLTVIELIFPVSAIILLIVLSYLPKMDYKNMYKYICVYSFMIAWATIRSFITYLMLPTPMFLCSMIGFILYFISDFILLFDRFYEHDYQFLRIMNLLTYYSGLFLIAYSLF